VVSALCNHYVARGHQAQFKFYSKAKTKLRNVAVDTFKARTSQPHFTTEKHAYPARKVEDNLLLDVIRLVLIGFRRPVAIEAMTLEENHEYLKHYNSIAQAITSLEKTNVVDVARAKISRCAALSQI